MIAKSEVSYEGMGRVYFSASSERGVRDAPAGGRPGSFLCAWRDKNVVGTPSASGEQMKIHGNHAHIGYINPKVLKAWLLAQFGDRELVAAIGSALAQGLNPWMVMEPIREALQQRLEQIRAVVKAQIVPMARAHVAPRSSPG
jgi:hypothetical protein